MPRRIVAEIAIEHVLYERELVAPQRVIVEMGEDPLSVRPSVVVLRIDLEGVGNEREFGRRVVGALDKETTVMPHLICLQMLHRELVHEPQFGVQRGIQGHKCLVSVLPD